MHHACCGYLTIVLFDALCALGARLNEDDDFELAAAPTPFDTDVDARGASGHSRAPQHAHALTNARGELPLVAGR
jgi:hypothetical protein